MSCRERSGVVSFREEKGETVTAFMSDKSCCKEKGNQLTPGGGDTDYT